MNEKEIEQLKKLLGPEFSSEELEAVLQEFPELLDRAESLSQAMESLRRETIPTLGPDFTDRVMARINAPSFWQKLWGAGHPVLKFGVASAVVGLLAVGSPRPWPRGKRSTAFVFPCCGPRPGRWCWWAILPSGTTCP
jgi:hypothetical protein